MRVTRLCLVRHGETDWNAEGRVQGQIDIPLNAAGRAQAQALAVALARHDFAAVHGSDLARVRQTAAPAAAALALPVACTAALRERHYGRFGALTYAEARERFPDDYARFRRRDPDFDFGSGESLDAFNARALDAVRGLAARHAGEAILVVTHGGVLEMVYRHARATGLSSPRDFEIPNAGINWIAVDGEQWTVESWADVAHLAAARDELPG